MARIKRRSPADVVFFTILFILMFIFAAIFVYELIWMVMGSMKGLKEYNLNPGLFINWKNLYRGEGEVFTWDYSWESIKENYEKAFTLDFDGKTLPDMIVNSIILVIGCTFLNVSIPAFAGYVVAKYNFRLKKWISIFAIITMVIPTVGSVSATYKFIFELHLMDTFAGVFIMAAGGIGFSFLMFKNFFEAIPWEYAEAGFIDGAGNMRVFLQIMLPQARPIIIAIAVVSFIGNWNDYYTPFMYLKNNPTIAVGLNEFKNSKYKSNYPVQFAAMTVTTSVVLVVYCFFNKTIMESMSAGGLKG